VIRREYGHPGGRRSAPLRILFKAKRQLQKLWFRRKCDLIPGTWRLKPHLQAETQFSSNAGLDKL
ncbi:MAG TPA: hypothetical protein PKW12_08265, partial [Verrucomicrobiota bacterium]|nr:hypothetical protein [Verrucomicrobiota bacterium]